MAKLQADTVTVTIPRALYDQMRQVVDTLGEAMAASDSMIKADEAQANAQRQGEELIQKIGPGLGGLGEELTAASNSGLGL